MEPFIIRNVRLSDALDIVGIHCSNIDTWTSMGPDGKMRLANYYELSIEDRWRHGGPWMSLETSSIHINNMLNRNNPFFVAQLGDRVVGEAELFIGQEASEFGRNAHLSILYVHRDYQRRGVGSELLKVCISTAERKRCDTFSVLPEKGAEEFYRRFGLRPFYKQRLLEVIVLHGREGYAFRDIWYPPYLANDLKMFIGRYQSSRQMWDQAAWPPYGFIPNFKTKSIREFKVDGGTILLFIEEGLRERRMANVMVWATPTLDIVNVTEVALNQCAKEGFLGAHLLVAESEAHELMEKYHAQGLFTEELWAKDII